MRTSHVRPDALVPPSPAALTVAIILALACLPLAAQQPSGTETESPQGEFQDVLVVTASRSEQPLHEAPTAMTVLTSEDIAAIPGHGYGDLLRTVPGLNVAQMAANDINVLGRHATGAATSELVLVDGRSLYLDFFGVVMWDFLPVESSELRQIEVVRGPGSAVWGANAASGVVQLITKPARMLTGFRGSAGAGERGTAYGRLSYGAASRQWAYKISASYYEQDPYDRPQGLIPGTDTPYPPFTNQGVEQPKLDVRVDHDTSAATSWSFSAGYSGAAGMMHTGMGPFTIDNTSWLSYAKVDWVHHAMQVSLHATKVDGGAENLLAVGPDGRPIAFQVKSDTYHLDLSDTRVLGDRHVLAYGADLRSSDFDLTIAPLGTDRDERGVYLQDEIRLGDRVRWLVGVRYDDIDPIDGVVSPRTSLLYSPNTRHTFRLSYGRGFDAPSVLENYAATAIVNQVQLPFVGPYVFPSSIDGNAKLQEQRFDAYELGWVGTPAKGTTVTISVYHNENRDFIDFYPAEVYTSADPPPGWPLPPFLLDVPPPLGVAGLFPSSFSFRNVGEIIDEGVEASLRFRPTSRWSAFVNYSYQADPEVRGIAATEINTPPKSRANLGLHWDGGSVFAGAVVSTVSEAFWRDVLDARFWGPTEAYTSVDLTVGLRLAKQRITLAVTGQNVFDERLQNHVFGDILSRRIVGELRFHID